MEPGVKTAYSLKKIRKVLRQNLSIIAEMINLFGEAFAKLFYRAPFENLRVRELFEFRVYIDGRGGSRSVRKYLRHKTINRAQRNGGQNTIKPHSVNPEQILFRV
jgi:hypothetical protein